MNDFEPPFKVTPLRCGNKLTDGLWHDIVDSTGTIVCRVPILKVVKEKVEEQEAKIDEHCKALVHLLNLGAKSCQVAKSVVVPPIRFPTAGEEENAPATQKSAQTAAKPVTK